MRPVIFLTKVEKTKFDQPAFTRGRGIRFNYTEDFWKRKAFK